MSIPPRTLIALSLIALGTALVAWFVGEWWDPNAAGVFVGLVLLVTGMLMGVSE